MDWLPPSPPFILHGTPVGIQEKQRNKRRWKLKNFLKEMMWVPYALGRRIVSVKLEDGKKEKVQKRLLLSNLKEIYEHFLIENPAVKVRFSAFAMLRPKVVSTSLTSQWWPVLCQGFCMYSDHMTHQIVAIYVFMEKLINDYVKLYLPPTT